MHLKQFKAAPMLTVFGIVFRYVMVSAGGPQTRRQTHQSSGRFAQGRCGPWQILRPREAGTPPPVPALAPQTAVKLVVP